MKYNHDWVGQQFSGDKPPKYIFFWGHRPKANGEISSSCMSQWFHRPFTHKELIYSTAEHWMMAEKARLFKDEEILQKILATDNPAVAKKLGRQVRGFDNETWATNRESIVKNGNYLKFSQHDDLKTYLVNSGSRILVESSPYDKIWGIGMHRDDAGIDRPENWKGLNLLGYALMEVRDLL